MRTEHEISEIVFSIFISASHFTSPSSPPTPLGNRFTSSSPFSTGIEDSYEDLRIFRSYELNIKKQHFGKNDPDLPNKQQQKNPSSLLICDFKNNVALERKATHCNRGGEGQRRLERNVKATEALERKKRNAEKGQIMVNLRAQKKAKQSTRDVSRSYDKP
nr:hypothetical protein [Tanacetum cinerariifolium]